MAIASMVGAKPQYLCHLVNDAINDKGLFIGLTFAFNNKWNYGLSTIHMTKLITETCSTVEQALKVFEKVPLCCPKNFFIADKKGGMVVVEHTSKQYKIIYPKNDILIQTNHYINKDLEKEDTVLSTIPTHTTFLRYYETLQKINAYKQRFILKDIIKILGDTKSCVCQNHKNLRTIWSLALDMKKSK